MSGKLFLQFLKRNWGILCISIVWERFAPYCLPPEPGPLWCFGLPYPEQWLVRGTQVPALIALNLVARLPLSVSWGSMGGYLLTFFFGVLWDGVSYCL